MGAPPEQGVGKPGGTLGNCRMKLTPQQWQRAEALFAQLLDLPQSSRAALLRQAADDPAVQREVTEMAAAMDTAGDFLLQPVQVNSIEAVVESVPAGTRYGAWRILGPLGRGGMGEVYRAERADGAYQQQVALKILKRGLDTDSLLQRFLRERRILAQLTHPNIAHLIDAGATPDGRPYLVMEYIEGRPITDWCVERRVPLPRMLALMCEVCDAVHAAHRRLVVHRDLKPSNVLVTADGTPKLLDFGIAKLLGEPDGEATLNGPGNTPVTPQYAAPEQILGQPVTTAADVYALGILLYQMLTGRLPRNHTSLIAAALALNRGHEPLARPSTALRARAGRDADGAALRSRAREVEGDLDLIVLKCLNDDPERRYRSAAELGDDLRHFLEQRPIVARPDSLGYRMRSFVRRNRLAVGAAAAILLVLVAGIAGFAREARRAQAQALRAEHVKDLVIAVFRQQDPLAPESEHTLTPARMVAASLSRADEELRDEPDLHADLLDNLGEIQFNLGDAEGSVATLQRAVREREAYYGPDSREVAVTLRKLTQPLDAVARNKEERAAAERALRILNRLGLGESVEAARVEVREALALAWGNGAPEETLALQARANRIFEKQLGPDDPETIQALWELAMSDEQARHDVEGEALLRDAISRYERLYSRDSVWLGRPLATLARILARNDQPEEAEALYRRSLAIQLPVLGPKHYILSNNFKSLGVLYAEKLGRFADAEKAFRDSQDSMTPGDDHMRIELLKETGRLHLAMGRADDAERELGESFALSRKILGEDKGITWYTGSEWGRALAMQGKLAQAESIQRQASQKLAQQMGQDAYQNCLIDDALADTLERRGKSADEVLALRRHALELTEKKYPKTGPLWAERATALARALLAQGGTAERTQAHALLDQAAADYRNKSTPMDRAGQSLLLRAELETGEGQRSAAALDVEDALQKLQQQVIRDPASLARAQLLLRGLKGS